MQLSLRTAGLGLLLSGLLIGTADPAAATEQGRTYVVKITNLTKGQVITPPAVIVHGGGFALFEIGQPASGTLATLAETGNPGPLADEVALDPHVSAVETGADGIPPGQTLVVGITADRRADRLSVAAMLASTNDAFAAVRGLALPRGRGVESTRAVAYDAGSEANNEACDFIPGPPCNVTNQRDTAGAEGFVHVHNGVHGGADLVPADHDWRNPVMEIVVTRILGTDDD